MINNKESKEQGNKCWEEKGRRKENEEGEKKELITTGVEITNRNTKSDTRGKEREHSGTC